MCLLLLAWKVHPRYELLLAANRDELHARPTAALDFWPDTPGVLGGRVLGGRDLVAAGTWLAARSDGRFAAVTNFRDESTPAAGMRSRGELVMRYFDSGLAPDAFTGRLAEDQTLYAGFNLIVGDSQHLCYASNRSEQFAQQLEPGLHALSNHRLGTPWPKVTRGLHALRASVDAGSSELEPLFEAMLEQHPGATDPVHRSENLVWPASSGPFVAGEAFGTRATTLMWRDGTRRTRVEERRFGPLGRPDGRTCITLAATGASA
jgi:uncharacterized protein with NRDE domain